MLGQVLDFQVVSGLVVLTGQRLAIYARKNLCFAIFPHHYTLPGHSECRVFVEARVNVLAKLQNHIPHSTNLIHWLKLMQCILEVECSE